MDIFSSFRISLRYTKRQNQLWVHTLNEQAGSVFGLSQTGYYGISMHRLHFPCSSYGNGAKAPVPGESSVVN